MSEYTLDQIVAEILNDKGHRANGLAPDIYFGAWEALNKWIEVKISKKKGADVPLLGTFTWEIINDQVSRPLFILNENFVKLHRVRRPRKFTEPVTAGSEDANYSQLAIKYSRKLTKDMMFIGIRDIVRKIGDYVDRMVEFEIPFSIGVLRSRQRKVKFEFNLGRLSEILPETLRQADALPDMNRNVPETARSTLSTMSTYSVDPTPRETHEDKKSKVPALPIGKNVRPMYTGNNFDNSTSSLTQSNEFPDSLDEYTSTGGIAETRSESGTGSESGYDGRVNASGKLEKPASPRMQELLVNSLDFSETIPLGSTYGEKQEIKKGRKLNACNMVQEQAFLRCLDSVAVGANYEDKWQMQSKDIRDQQIAEEKRLQEKRQMEKKKSQELLKEQIQKCRENSKKAEMERKLAEFKFHIGGEKSGYVDDVLGGKSKSMDKTQIKKLEMQIQENKLRREQSKQAKRKEEKEYLDHVAMEIDMKNVADHIEHLEKQQLLLSSWERDGHLRNLKRLQEQGARSVHRYINENVAEEIDPDILSRTKTTAIGFDSRSGRK